MMKNRRMEKMIYPDFINKIRIDFGKRIAVKENETEISYEELGRMSDSMGAYLLENGTRPRENVLIQLENSILFVACLFAVLRIGAVPVLIYPACRENEITSIAENTNPSTYISFRSYKGYDYSELATRISQKVNSIKNMYFSDELESLDIKKYRLDVCDIGRPSQDDMAILILSGGSTGIPKLIARKHGEHITAARLCANACGLKQDSVFLLSMPAAHNFNLAGPGLLGTLLMGGKVVMCKNSNPAEIVSLIRKEKITETALIPSLASECIIYAKKNLSLSVFDSLRLVQLGGAVCPADVVMQVYEDMQCTPQQIYGMGEGIIFSTSPDDPIERILYYQGENISPWDQVRIVDEQGNQVPEGEYGELIAKGPCIITGYYNKEANRNKFTKDGFYRTGDRVRLVEGKYLQVSGRMDDMINKGGEKIYPAEVEMHINTCKGVESSTVLGIADSSYGQLLCAFVITENNEVTPLMIRNKLIKDGVAAYKIPDEFIFIDKWPLTSVNKIDKHTLKKIAKEKRKETEIVESLVFENMDGIEHRIAAEWARILKVREIKKNSNFIELGGNSMSVSSMLEKVNDSFSTKVSMEEFYSSTDFEDFVNLIKEKI